MIKVLIVEDDPMVAVLNKRYVESIEGFKVVGIAETGDEALKYIKNKNINLIILDVYMPKLNGISLLKEMRKSSILTDVILVTASKEVENIDEALKLGAIDYLIKPFEYERLKESLENYLKRRFLFQEKEFVAQEDIDKITMGDKQTKDNKIQKGLHKKTLNRIKDFMEKNHDFYITADEVSNKLGFSKVTVRKYLEYLESIGEIKSEVEYGSIGRPSYLYKFLD